VSRRDTVRRCSLALVSLLALAASANADPGTLILRADDGSLYESYVQRVEVPERHAVHDGPRLELATIRIRHPSAHPGAPAHVVLAGGPGASGIELVSELARRGGRPLFDLLQGDLVGIDQRGTGKSVPTLDDASRYMFPLEEPGDPIRWQQAMQVVAGAAVARQHNRGTDLSAYNTVESADDVDAVRRALGLERIVLWGRSYGSHLALAVLRRHPDAVARVVLANPEGPDHTLKRPALVDAAIKRLGDRLAANAEWRHQLPDLPATIQALTRQLDMEPRFVDTVNPATGQPVRVGIGRFDIEWLLSRMLSETRTLAMVPSAVLHLRSGEFGRAGAIIALHRSRLGVESLMKQAMDASSGASASRRALIAEEAAVGLLGNAINFPMWQMHDAWGARDLGDEYRQPVESDAPLLLLAGDLDVRTPVENAHELAASLGNAVVVVIENGAHDFGMFDSLPVRERLRQFLRGEEVDKTPIRLELAVLPP
jgi:pimeloyl-ACP methyl ester carboxylesterase